MDLCVFLLVTLSIALSFVCLVVRRAQNSRSGVWTHVIDAIDNIDNIDNILSGM